MDKKSLAKKIPDLFDKAVDLLAVLGAIPILGIMIAITFSVILRYFLNLSLVGLVELCAMSLLFVTFLGSPWVLRRNGHTSMDVVIKQFRPRTRAFINMSTSLVCAIICFIMVWYGTQVFWTRFQKGTYLFSHVNIPDAYFLFVIPLGSLFLFIQFLRRSYKFFKSWIT